MKEIVNVYDFEKDSQTGLYSFDDEIPVSIHVHIAVGRASANATKLWITRTGKVILNNNNSKIPMRILTRLMRVI